MNIGMYKYDKRLKQYARGLDNSFLYLICN
jgi:hypothetical protein